jgi:transcriptional regulator of acetoin/glycerol metabolism
MFVRIIKSDGTFRSLDRIIDDVLNLALIHCEGKKTQAAKQLTVPRSTFYRKFKAGE